MNQKNYIESVVIGLGNIGMLYDYHKDDKVFTHSKAIEIHPSFNLSAGIDICKKKRKLFEKKYHKPAYCKIEDLLETSKEFSFFSISTPANLHKETYNKILQFNPKIVLCEKPVGRTYKEAFEISKASKIYKIKTYVNFIRRFDKSIRKLKQWILLGNLGKLRKVVAKYSGGIKNNASHLIDLIFFLIGDNVNPEKVQIINLKKNDDKDFLLLINNEISLFFLSMDTNNYESLELELLFTEGKIVIEDGGKKINIYRSTNDTNFSKYKILIQSDIKFHFDLDKYQYSVLECISENCKPNISNALVVSKIVEKILRELNE